MCVCVCVFNNNIRFRKQIWSIKSSIYGLLYILSHLFLCMFYNCFQVFCLFSQVSPSCLTALLSENKSTHRKSAGYAETCQNL